MNNNVCNTIEPNSILENISYATVFRWGKTLLESYWNRIWGRHKMKIFYKIKENNI